MDEESELVARKRWVHCFEQELSEQQQEIIQRGLEEFLPQWVSHGTPVKAAFKILSGHVAAISSVLQAGGKASRQSL